MINVKGLAKLSWRDPKTGVLQEYILEEGATATIGRSSSNDIHIPEQHVSRQHAVIRYVDGVFVITDLGSANGTFINDQQITEPYPLFSGDRIRLFVPEIVFSATVTQEERDRAEEKGTVITATMAGGKGSLIISNGPQEGQVIPLLLEEVRVGRATNNADWEIALQDPAVSRPHARLHCAENHWVIYDLGSSNGTFVNDNPVSEKGRPLRDGDIIQMGTTLIVFRAKETQASESTNGDTVS